MRNLRNGTNVSERIVWEFLRKQRTGHAFRRQYPVYEYVLDFYCPQTKVCVEVDGEQHSERRWQDERRDQFLESIGILTIRIPSQDIFDKTGKPLANWLERITRCCDERSV